MANNHLTVGPNAQLTKDYLVAFVPPHGDDPIVVGTVAVPVQKPDGGALSADKRESYAAHKAVMDHPHMRVENQGTMLVMSEIGNGFDAVDIDNNPTIKALIDSFK